MSFGDPNNPYGQQPQQPQQGGQPYGYPQQPQGQPGYGYPQQAPQGVPPQQGYGYPQQPGYPQQQAGYPGHPQQMYGGAPQYAHWGLRAGGLIVDGLVFGVAYIPALIGIAIAQDSPEFATILSILGFVLLVGLAIYQLIQEGKTGQTIGKKALGIRLLRETDGQPLGVGMAFVRRLAHFLDSLACYLGWLWPLWDAKKQCFADKVCGSIVVKG
ncbi:RDD family protein [Streptomyces sp. LHD-70]|uniref:RDD family protein n=1 Tax=Streptomyces sp. LHD-70 TaxID=3072140 RepID=UPI00280F21AB|nr:RDD family protein [Streptomyces sp. LHD-70]MDQ8704260.1 RDD family protein [Streptomyces sp. LHD-70]